MREEEKAVLRARREKLAEVPQVESRHEELLVLECTVGVRKYAFESRWIKEVTLLEEVGKLPGAPAVIVGVTNVRGQIIGVLNLERFFGSEPGSPQGGRYLVIVTTEQGELGIAVETVIGLRTWKMEEIQEGTEALMGSKGAYSKGVTVEGTILLDIEKIISEVRQ